MGFRDRMIYQRGIGEAPLQPNSGVPGIVGLRRRGYDERSSGPPASHQTRQSAIAFHGPSGTEYHVSCDEAAAVVDGRPSLPRIISNAAQLDDNYSTAAKRRKHNHRGCNSSLGHHWRRYSSDLFSEHNRPITTILLQPSTKALIRSDVTVCTPWARDTMHPSSSEEACDELRILVDCVARFISRSVPEGQNLYGGDTSSSAWP